ncbi:hypothetical protein [Anaerococcus sp. Marseille-P9784]|uniref:hypothetical protein n=1 Tax=Anaerococcus sp. Marseille-P9784 TaxID=2614127 RepID=UPI00124A5935|nr:hypothetical protein [Anaerococcus sp. Marseille-P9784]
MNITLPLQSSFKWRGRKFGDGKAKRKAQKDKISQETGLPKDYIEKAKKRTLKIPFTYNKFFIFLKAKFDKIFKLVCIRDGKVNSKYIDRINKFYNGRASDLYKLNYQILARSLEINTRYYSDISLNNSLIDYENNINICPDYLKESRFVRKKGEYLSYLKRSNKTNENLITDTNKFVYFMMENDQYLLGQLRSKLDEKIRLYIDWAKLANKTGLESYVIEKPSLIGKYNYHYNKQLNLGQVNDIKESDASLLDIVASLDFD